jgi:hypothetical protein
MRDSKIIWNWGFKTYEEHLTEGCRPFRLNTCCGSPPHSVLEDWCSNCEHYTDFLCEICEEKYDEKFIDVTNLRR